MLRDSFLNRPHADPLHTRHGMSRAQYASPYQRFQRARRRIPARLVEWVAMLLIGAAIGVMLAWRG